MTGVQTCALPILHRLAAPVRDPEEKYIRLLAQLVQQGSGAVQLTGKVRFCAAAVSYTHLGDQAAEMTPDGFTFHGGVSHGVEKRSKVRSRIVADQLVKLIKEAVHVVIMGHRMSDLDAIGAVSYTHLDVYKRQTEER